MHQWVDAVLAPAITRQGRQGWNILAALEDVLARAQVAGDEHSAAAVAAVDKRARKVGERGAGSLLGAWLPGNVAMAACRCTVVLVEAMAWGVHACFRGRVDRGALFVQLSVKQAC